MAKKIIVLFSLVVIAIPIVFYLINQEEKGVLLPQISVIEEEVEPNVYTENESVVKIYVPDNQTGSLTEKELVLSKDENIEETIINHILYNEIKTLNEKTIPQNIVIKTEIWNETLKISFGQNIEDYKVNDRNKEEIFFASLTNSLLNNSKLFTDVQFLIEGERSEKLLGVYNTENPFAAFTIN